MRSPLLHLLAQISLRRLYRYFISPALHWIAGPTFGCRFVPTCSEYAAESLQMHRWKQGGWLALKRICRCHPFSEAGYDPVPRAIGNPHRTRIFIQGR